MKNLLFWLIACTLLFTSCDDKGSKITIIGENSSNIQAMESLEKEYESNHEVDLVFKPNTWEDAFNKSNQDFANKTGLYDIILQYNFSLSSFVRNDYVYNLDELKQMTKGGDYSFEDKLFENVWKEVGYYYKNPQSPQEGELQSVGYPFSANTMLLVYNKQLFNDPQQQQAYKERYGQELSVPKDMESFYRVAEFFTQPEKDLKGVVLQGATGGWLYYEWISLLQGFDGKVMDKDQGWKGNASTPILLMSPQSIEAANYYKSLKPFNAGNFTTIDAVEQRNILEKGKVAMGIIWSDYMWGLIDEGNGKFDERFGFAPTPGDKSIIAGGAFYINKQSKYPAAAFEYELYLMQETTQIKMIQQGLCSPMKTAYDAPEVQKVPYIKALKTSLERAVYMMEAAPDADLISNALTSALQKIWNDELTAEQGMQQAKEEIERGRAELFK